MRIGAPIKSVFLAEETPAWVYPAHCYAGIAEKIFKVVSAWQYPGPIVAQATAGSESGHPYDMAYYSSITDNSSGCDGPAPQNPRSSALSA